MRSAQLPPVRVKPAVREQVEQSLREGESLSEVVEAAALQAARQQRHGKTDGRDQSCK